MNQQMQEKEKVNYKLTMVNSSLTNYAKAISDPTNQQLRQTLQQIRNSDEQFQFQLSQMAEQKQFYKPAQVASQQDIQQVKSNLQS